MSEILGGLTLLRDVSALADWRNGLAAGQSLGLVPTMGALHEGHGSLVRAAGEQCDAVLVSLFVNPLQFNDSRDLEAYPRNEAADLELLEGWGADAAFLPTIKEMAPACEADWERAGELGAWWEGEFRPGHFDGMLTVVRRLFQKVRPTHAWFGEKDAQQLFLVQQLAARLGTPEIVAGATLREADGLALSSRNQQLSAEDRQRALALRAGLQEAKQAYEEGMRDVPALESLLRAPLEAADLQVDYAALVGNSDFAPAVVTQDGGPWLAIVAAHVGTVRLIDNLLLGEEAG